MRIKITVLIASILLVFSAFSESNDLNSLKWIVKSDYDNLIVFKAVKKHESGLIPLKVQTTLNYPISRVVSVLTNAERKKEWVPRLVKAYTVKKIALGEFVDYVSFDAPWPFTNRDFLVYIKCDFNLKNEEIHSKIHSISLPEVPVKKNFIRGHTHSGNTFLRSVSGGTKTYMEMAFLSDYKGNIPKWIINIVQTKWPRRLVKRLRTQLAKNDIVDQYKERLAREKEKYITDRK